MPIHDVALPFPDPPQPVTNQRFATAVGIHFTMASRLRSGKRRPSADLMLRIERAFGLSMADQLAAFEQGAGAYGSLLRERVFEPQPSHITLDQAP